MKVLTHNHFYYASINMVAKNEHRQRTGCPIACSLDIIGDHWTLVIIRSLMFKGIHEYKDLLAEEEQISTSILTTRLKKLEVDGLISSIAHPQNKKRKLYYLTKVGRDLMGMLIEMVLWANKHLADRLSIPADQKALLKKDPAEFARLMEAQLDSWEERYLI